VRLPHLACALELPVVFPRRPVRVHEQPAVFQQRPARLHKQPAAFHAHPPPENPCNLWNR
jgi:hypothetical protein